MQAGEKVKNKKRPKFVYVVFENNIGYVWHEKFLLEAFEKIKFKRLEFQIGSYFTPRDAKKKVLDTINERMTALKMARRNLK